MYRPLLLVIGLTLTLTLAGHSDAPPPQDPKPEIRNPKPDFHGDPLPANAIARMGTTRFRAGSSIHALIFSPDGKILAAAGGNGKVYLWDFASGKALRTFSPPHDPALRQAQAPPYLLATVISSPAFLPDGKTLLTSLNDKAVFWNLETGKEIRTLEKFPDRLISISPDGQRAIVGDDRNSRLWDLARNKAIRDLNAPAAADILKEIIFGDEFESVVLLPPVFSPDGKTVAAAENRTARGNQAVKNRIRIWDAATGVRTKTLPLGEIIPQKLLFAPDGKVLAVLDENEQTIHLWDLAGGKEPRQLAIPQIGALAFSPDGKTLAAVSAEESLRIVDVTTGKELRHLTGLLPWIDAVAFSPDGKVLVAGGGNNTLHRWDTTAWKEILPFGGHQGLVESVVFSPDGKTLLSSSTDQTIRTWDIGTGKELRRVAAPKDDDGDFFSDAAFSADGKTLNGCIMTDGENRFCIVDALTGKELHKFPATRGGIWGMTLAPQGKTLVTQSAEGGEPVLRLWNLALDKEIRRFTPQPKDLAPDENEKLVTTVSGLTFSPDGKTLAARTHYEVRNDGRPDPGDEPREAKSTNVLCIWETATGKERRQILLPRELPAKLAVPIPMQHYRSHRYYVLASSLAFSPCGKTVAMLGDRDTILLYDLIQGKESLRLKEPGVNGATLLFSPDGKLLVAGTDRGAVCLWDVTRGLLLGRCEGHGGVVTTLAFSADGKRLASGSTDTSILVWDATPWAAQAREQPLLRGPLLTAKQLETSWADLAGDDAGMADEAIRLMVASPVDAVPFLKKALRPADIAAELQKIGKLIADLDSDQFEVREQAEKELAQLGNAAEPALKKALANRHLSPEVRRRIGRLTEKLEARAFTSETLRTSRSLEILEMIGTPEAGEVIERLARGTPEAEGTREAQASLERLWKRDPGRKR